MIQAQLFEKTIGSPVKIIVFEMKDELMRVRLEGRGNFDDRKDAIKKRIDNYNEGTKPVIKAYSNLVKSVSGRMLIVWNKFLTQYAANICLFR